MAYYYRKEDDFKFVPVSKTKEKKLFRTFYAFKGTGLDDGPYTQTGAPGPVEVAALAARNQIIELYLLMVVKISLRTANGVIPEDMAISAGNFGFLKVLESRKFRYCGKNRFSSFFRHNVRGQVIRAVKDYIHNEGVVKSESTALGNFNDLKEDWDISGREWLVHSPSEGNQLNEARRDKIIAATKRMTATERASVMGVGLEGKTFKQVGDEIGKSRQAVQQAYARALPKLQRLFSSPANQELAL